MCAQSGSGYNCFNLYLKAEGYSVVQTNILPTAGNALSVVAAFAFGIAVDTTRQPLTFVCVVQVLMILSNALLAVWNIPKAALLVAFYLSFIGAAGQPVIIVRIHPNIVTHHLTLP